MERGNSHCKGPEVGTCLVQEGACGWRGASKVRDGTGEVRRGAKSRWCRGLQATVGILAFTLSKMEPQEGSEQGRAWI